MAHAAPLVLGFLHGRRYLANFCVLHAGASVQFEKLHHRHGLLQNRALPAVIFGTVILGDVTSVRATVAILAGLAGVVVISVAHAPRAGSLHHRCPLPVSALSAGLRP